MMLETILALSFSVCQQILCGAIFQSGFVDNHLGSLGLDTLHHTLDRTLTEVVGVAFHREAINTDDGKFRVMSYEF